MRWDVSMLVNAFFAADRPYIGGPMGCAGIFFYLVVWAVEGLEERIKDVPAPFLINLFRFVAIAAFLRTTARISPFLVCFIKENRYICNKLLHRMLMEP